jgi:protein involved in polysaccharide export with SLBB domain
LAEAGGLTDRGVLRRISVGRRGPGGKMIIKQYNLDEYIKNGKVEANPRIEPGDVLLFDEKRELTVATISQILSSALLIDTLIRR